MILRSAKELGCGILHSADLNPGQAYEGMEVRSRHKEAIRGAARVSPARALVMDHGGQKKEHHDNEAERHEAAAQAGLPVAGDPAVSGLDVTVRGMGAIGMPAQDAADNQND